MSWIANTILTNRFQDALGYAYELHGRQIRKATGVPYMAHLLSVSALVLEDGGSEDEAIAALLHDAGEDQGGEETLEEINRRYGATVAEIVRGCSDTLVTPKPPWRERKEKYLRELQSASPAVQRVSLADKVHNARDLLACYRSSGEEIWLPFKGGKDGTLWYQRALVQVFQELGSGAMVEELDRLVTELEQLSG
ncbi:MAG TPA: HD domain-containing protein [Anaerolineaceae bacterium]|nr:HD domain-containing protein [Anaerolineaceae bacterium]